MFPAEEDRLYLSLGDGRFEDVTERCGIVAPDGKGLGSIVADFHNSGRLSIYVSNDTTANFFFVNQAEKGSFPEFTDEAFLAGIAYDAAGRGQASMGIGTEDINGDGLLDLLVAAFYNEFNTLYLSQGPGVYLDASRQVNLDQLSFTTLTFGLQFLDADLDGDADVLVGNGHVNDFSDRGLPYEMAPEVYRNDGRGRFSLADAQELGAYFQGKYLARSVVRLDFNRDGLPDGIVTHIDAPVALLANQSRPAGHYLTLLLRGTESPRDAIGTTVTLTANGRTQMRQLTAGDGFQASNERVLTFGLARPPR